MRARMDALTRIAFSAIELCEHLEKVVNAFIVDGSETVRPPGAVPDLIKVLLAARVTSNALRSTT